MALQQARAKDFGFERTLNHKLSLSSYFPKDTCYYYGYPFGQDSGFLNGDSSVLSAELIAARPFSCAGPDVRVVAFASSMPPRIPRYVLGALRIEIPKHEQLILLPEISNKDERSVHRNQLIKQTLITRLPRQSLIMAQPYIDQELESYCQIPTDLTCYLNDKKNLAAFVDTTLVPKNYGLYHTGAELLDACRSLSFPYVIKVTASSGGDGVFICHNAEEFKRAADHLAHFTGTLYVEEYVNAKHNCSIQFGVPYDKNAPIEIIGISEQLTTDDGEFMGGIVPSDPTHFGDNVIKVADYAAKSVLPRVRKMGWYGIGCFDVLIDQSGRAFIVDANFRMTGMSSSLFMIRNDNVQSNVLSCSISFEGPDIELIQVLRPFVEQRTMKIMTLNCAGNLWKANVCLLYENGSDLTRNIELLRASGCSSQVFEKYGEQAWN